MGLRRILRWRTGHGDSCPARYRTLRRIGGRSTRRSEAFNPPDPVAVRRTSLFAGSEEVAGAPVAKLDRRGVGQTSRMQDTAPF